MKTKIKSFFFLDEAYDYEEDAEEEVIRNSRHQPTTTKQQNVVSLQSVQKSSKVILAEPRTYAESQDVADHLKNRRAVVVNLQRIDQDQAKRIVDFLSGTVYAIGGDIQKIGVCIFLCTPDNVEVSGSISEVMQEQEYQDARW